MVRMNEQQQTDLAQLLANRRADLQDNVDRLRAAMSQPAEGGWPEVRDSVEDGDARMMVTLDVTQLQRHEDELREVMEAQERLRRGDYGRCEECDEPIQFERLQVRPEARFCMRHEQAWEKAHAQGSPVQS